jgi:hypothetical protein
MEIYSKEGEIIPTLTAAVRLVSVLDRAFVETTVIYQFIHSK